MKPGIPPSLDRQDRVITLVVFSVIIAVLFIAAVFVISRRTPSPLVDGGFGTEESGRSRLEAYLAEEVRASAYEALRDHMDSKKGDGGIARVYCRDSSHRWIDDEIEFQGDVDFELFSGVMERHVYQARLSGSRESGWEVLSVEIGPPLPIP